MEHIPAEEIARQVWLKHEAISHTLQTLSKNEYPAGHSSAAMKRLPGRQGDILSTVRQLCQHHPEGVPLKTVAKHLAVTSPTASVMVDNLVEQGLLERSTSSTDRRIKNIRLSTKAETLYQAREQAMLHNILHVVEQLEPSFLNEWHTLLQRIEDRLRGLNH